MTAFFCGQTGWFLPEAHSILEDIHRPSPPRQTDKKHPSATPP
jgi:hypothetical protein